MGAHRLEEHPLHLGLGAAAEMQPAFTGEIAWYEAYAARHAADGAEGRLVSLHRFAGSWEMWEMHPHGAEVVVCIAGAMVLVQQQAAGAERRIALAAGEYAINPPGTWHTADIAPGEGASAIFITAGLGTEHRARG